MKKFIRLNCGSHLEGKCPEPKCEGQLLVPIHPTERATIKVRNLDMGIHEATCGHKHQVIGTK